MSSIESIQELERRLGFELPSDYRHFLASHSDHRLERSLVFKEPRSGIVDELLTVEDILKNDEEDQIGIPEQSLMHIGSNLMGGYLYMDVSVEAFGIIRYSEGYQLREDFDSFTCFIEQTESEQEDEDP